MQHTSASHRLSPTVARIAAATFAALACIGAQAQQMPQGLYVAPQITQFSIADADVDDVKPLGLGVRVGVPINANFAVEGRLGAGIKDDSVNVDILGTDVNVDVKMKNYYGVYAKGILPVSEAVSVYGLLGYTRAKIELSALGVTDTQSEDDVSYGAGFDFTLSPTATLGLEWARLIDKDGSEADGLSASVAFKF